MMNYEIFKEVVTEKFMDYLSVHYKDMKLEIRPIDKVNVTLDGMNLMGEGDVTVTPTIYINNMYEHYQKTNDLQEVLQMAASKMEHAIKEAPDVVPAIDFNAAKDNIVFQLVNTEQNKEMLRDIPNRSFQDLSIIYRWIVKTDVEGIQSTVIHNSLAEKQWSKTEMVKKPWVAKQKILEAMELRLDAAIDKTENLARDVEIDHMMKKFDSLMEKDCDKRIITIFTEPILQYGAEVFEEFEKSKTLSGCENEVKNSETKINCIYR